MKENNEWWLLCLKKEKQLKNKKKFDILKKYSVK